MPNRFIRKTISYEKDHKKNKKWAFLALMTGIIGIIIIAGTSYAVLSSVQKGSEQTVTTGTFATTFTEGQFVNLTNAYPMTDAEGQGTTAYTFTIKNTGSLTSSYQVRLEEDAKNTLSKDKIKYIIQKDGGAWSSPALLSTLSDQAIFVTNQPLNSGASVTYKLKLWVDNAAGNEVQGLLFKAKVVVESVVASTAFSDTIPPVITLAGDRYPSVVKGATYTDPGITSVSDNVDGTILTSKVTKTYEYYNGIATSTVSSVDTSKVGIYYIYYQAIDAMGNKGIVVRVVSVKESTSTKAPTITVKDPATQIAIGNKYLEKGASAVDATGTDITSRLIVSGSVNTDVLGSYVIKYTVSDKDGNIASVTKTMSVIQGVKHTLTNIIKNSGAEEDSVWFFDGVAYSTLSKHSGNRSFYYSATSEFNMATQPTIQPLHQHIYYMSRYIKTEGEATPSDCRFEMFIGDDPGNRFIFGANSGNFSTWTRQTEYLKVENPSQSSNWIIRNFQANPAGGDLYLDDMMIIDLSPAFGVGKEPSREWCEANLTYFDGTSTIQYIT